MRYDHRLFLPYFTSGSYISLTYWTYRKSVFSRIVQCYKGHYSCFGCCLLSKQNKVICAMFATIETYEAVLIDAPTRKPFLRLYSNKRSRYLIQYPRRISGIMQV
jgi:hypothetical protein